MRKLAAVLSLGCLASFSSALLAQAQDAVKPLAIEQRMFNDFAVHMQRHLHETAVLLDKIRQSSDMKEREKLMKEYHHATQAAMQINHAMDMLIGENGGMMKGGKKIAAKGGGMGCMMMKKKSASAEQESGDVSSQEDADAATAEAGLGNEAGKSSEHEGHH
jgi:hypothetical protein